MSCQHGPVILLGMLGLMILDWAGTIARLDEQTLLKDKKKTHFVSSLVVANKLRSTKIIVLSDRAGAAPVKQC